MHLSKVNEALQHKIVGGSIHQWNCWPNSRFLDYENIGAYASVVFSIETQEIYTAEINSNREDIKPYRWLNPLYKQSYVDEAKEKNVDINIAWDSVKWVDLETSEDWLEKATAIFNNEEFDDRVKVPVNLEKDELFELMTLAHERDITLNQLVENLLQNVIDKEKNERLNF